MNAPFRPGLVAAKLLFALAMLFSGLAAAQAPLQAPEHQVKATFVYKFGEYVDWPADALPAGRGALRIGVIGADALADELERLVNGRTMAGHPVVVDRLAPGDALEGLHLIYVGAAASAQLAQIDGATRTQAVLIVTESDADPDPLSAINFVLVGDRVRFDVALGPAERRGIRISSRLLAVARRVAGAGP